MQEAAPHSGVRYGRCSLINPTERLARCEREIALAVAESHKPHTEAEHAGILVWELEWRIVLQARQDALVRSGFLKFRRGQFGHTPFVEIPPGLTAADTSPLRRIVVGPGNNKEGTKRWVELLLETRGIRVKRDNRPDIKDGVEVAISLIPYRSA